MDNNPIRRVLIFSLVSGDIYEIESDELKNLDQYQIPLKKRPKQNCKKCYGRLYIGYNKTIQIYQPCPSCVQRCVDFDLMKGEEEIEIKTIKETDQLEMDEAFNEALADNTPKPPDERPDEFPELTTIDTVPYVERF